MPESDYTILFITVPAPEPSLNAKPINDFPHLIILGDQAGNDLAELHFRDDDIFIAVKTMIGALIDAPQQMNRKVLDSVGAILENLFQRDGLNPRHAREFTTQFADAIESEKKIKIVDTGLKAKSPASGQPGPSGRNGEDPQAQRQLAKYPMQEM